MDVAPDIHFRTLIEVRAAEDHDGNILAQTSTFAYAPGTGNCAGGIETRTEENQVRTLKACLQDRFLHISGCVHLVAAGVKQALHAATGLFHILNYQDDRTTLLMGITFVLYERTSFF